MAVRKPKDHLSAALELIARNDAARAAGRPAERLMSVEERLAFADHIRARTRPTTEDSTDLIRRDRDER